ncbi:hypothetical protein AAHN97_14910 [Chitinophaga niabensis]|uniref:hypothetical protein n=1 Tax=Chitinophaga niabensis TaxID=536979 RepID=UPI0031BA6661
MPDRIQFQASFGLQVKTVEISKVYGAGDSYHVYIDRYYNGSFIKTNLGYAKHLPPNSQLTSDDIQIIEELIEGLSM